MKIIPVYTWNKGILQFNLKSNRLSKKPWFQGVLLLACVVLAMLLANLPFTKELYHSILETNIRVHLYSDNGAVNVLFPRDMNVEKFINDILMVIFFFTVGLEIKREVAHGELSSMKKALLPIIAAFGGVILPAIIYTVVNHGTVAASGWGIPTATDIAFAVCILSMLGDRVPISLKVFLTALAIADDLIAILVVALFYGGSINFLLLGIAAIVIALTFVLEKLGEKRMFPYLVCAFAVWVLFYYSGIHATMSGVVMAFLIPSKPRYNKAQYIHKRDRYIARLEKYDGIDSEGFPNGPQKHCLRRLETIAHGSMDMSYRVEHALSPWVNFLIMPIFALANAGVEITDPSYFNVFNFSPELGSVSMGIFLGLLLGKPLGITLFSWIAIKCRIGAMPEKSNWPLFFAVACLGGIGFTMSIFVDTLSFADAPTEVMMHLRDAGKIAVLLGSLCSGILGSILITLFSAKKTE
ncbi:MAG: Na+/H+ antiporter NhaA [Candidatus Cryptobacteroides sp.]|nr:Na+/H+ antiporter NhaA [Bacteroidales bacterium]MDY6159043.1 Na+/H+ antiporter NhaA [Candidatus Cryptobacteroides sp.]